MIALLLIGLLLLVAASAHVCKRHISQMNLDGDYWGMVGTGAGPADSTSTIVVYATSKGEEFCNFTGQEDWNSFWLNWSTGEGTWAGPAIVAGTGGYATGNFDCIFGFGHSLFWFYKHEWRNVHGEDGEDSPPPECIDLRESATIGPCPD